MTVNQNNMPVHNGKIVDTLNKDMPGSEDWEFVQDSVQFSDVSVKKAITFSDTKPQTMTISLKDFDKQITITYKTRLTDEGLKKAVGQWHSADSENSAQLTGKEVADTVKAEVSKTIGWDVLRKTVSFDGGQYCDLVCRCKPQIMRSSPRRRARTASAFRIRCKRVWSICRTA